MEHGISVKHTHTFSLSLSIYIYIYTCIWLYPRANSELCLRACMYVSMYPCMHTRMHVYMYMRAYNACQHPSLITIMVLSGMCQVATSHTFVEQGICPVLVKREARRCELVGGWLQPWNDACATSTFSICCLSFEVSAQAKICSACLAMMQTCSAEPVPVHRWCWCSAS